MVYESILPNVQHQKRFVLLIHLQGLWISVDIWHALVWVDREKENHAHWSLSALSSRRAGYCAGRDVSVYSSVCLLVSRCSRKEACEKWTEPLHFSTELKLCVDITVSPDNMSVTSASTQVIEFYMQKITLHNAFLLWTLTTASFIRIAFTV